MIAFELSEADKASGLWLRLKAHFEDRLQDARRRNDRVQAESDTAAIRGEIQAFKRLLALGSDRPLTGEEDLAP